MNQRRVSQAAVAGPVASAPQAASPARPASFKRHKYGAKKTVLDGITFDSKAEAKRWAELKNCERGGEIEDLERQPVYKVKINGKHICTWKGDFRYRDKHTGEIIIEDVKGVRTPVYRLKKKMVEAYHGIEIVEVRA